LVLFQRLLRVKQNAETKK